MSSQDSRIDARRLSKEPTLRKLAAHVRWFIEKTRAKPEDCAIVITVPDDETKALIGHQFEHEYDPAIMRRYINSPHIVEVLGMRISVVKLRKDAPKVAPPKEPA